MATKTISIDLEAYRRLKSRQKDGESFSQTIKRIVQAPFDFEAWLRRIEANPVSDEFVEAVEEQIAQRRAPHNMGRRYDAVSGHHRSRRSDTAAAKKRTSKSR